MLCPSSLNNFSLADEKGFVYYDKTLLALLKEQPASKQDTPTVSSLQTKVRQERNYTTLIDIFKLFSDNEACLEILFFAEQRLIILGQLNS